MDRARVTLKFKELKWRGLALNEKLLNRIRYALTTEPLSHLDQLIALAPGETGRILRAKRWRGSMGKVGENSNIGYGLMVLGASGIELGENFLCQRNCTLSANDDGRIIIGDNVFLNHNVTLDSGFGGLITIDNYTTIGMNSVLRSSNHEYERRDIPVTQQGNRPGQIVLGEDVWIAASVTLLPGTILGRGCIVSAGSVVSGQYPDYSILAGNPARIIGLRGNE